MDIHSTPSQNQSYSQLNTNIGHYKLSKQDFLAQYKSKYPVGAELLELFEKMPELFSACEEEPENSKKKESLDNNDAFLPPSTQNFRHRTFPEKHLIKKKVIPKFPFVNFAENQTDRLWYYIDEGHKIQGPFTSLEMDFWFENGYFFHELLIRFKENNEFTKLIDLFGKCETVHGDDQGTENDILKSMKKKSSVEQQEINNLNDQSNWMSKVNITQSLNNLDEQAPSIIPNIEKAASLCETPKVNSRQESIAIAGGELGGIKRSNITRREENKLIICEKEKLPQPQEQKIQNKSEGELNEKKITQYYEKKHESHKSESKPELKTDNQREMTINSIITLFIVIININRCAC